MKNNAKFPPGFPSIYFCEIIIRYFENEKRKFPNNAVCGSMRRPIYENTLCIDVEIFIEIVMVFDVDVYLFVGLL